MTQSYDLGNIDVTNYNIHWVRQPEDQSDILLEYLMEKKLDRTVPEESKTDINKQVELLLKMKRTTLMASPLVVMLTPKGELVYPTVEVIDPWPFDSKFDLEVTEQISKGFQSKPVSVHYAWWDEVK